LALNMHMDEMDVFDNTSYMRYYRGVMYATQWQRNVKNLSSWRIIHQKGSHIKVGKNGDRETIPMHKELKKGLEQKLLKRIGYKR